MIYKKPSISIIVPVYNERENIEHFHKQLLKVLDKLSSNYEIIYIDDRSTDGTYQWLRRNVNTETVTVLEKRGKKGKAYSLVEGFSAAQGDILGMIDGDLQYPPQALPEMLKQLSTGADIVVANRKYTSNSFVRRFLSKSFRYFFGKALFGLSTDTQSGLKLFTRKAYETVRFAPTSAWAFDLEFLYRAYHAGFTIVNHDIQFASRKNGESKVNILAASFELGINALMVRFKKAKPLVIPPAYEGTMQGAGVGHKQKQYITHTTLPIDLSAMKTFSMKQKFLILSFLYLFGVCLVIFPIITLSITVSVISLLYFFDSFFTLSIILRSLSKKGEISITEDEITSLPEHMLPVYSILCPLYKEAHIVPQFLEAIQKLDYPKDKLDVMLLLEEDDKDTIATIQSMYLPSYVRIVVVPDSQPKTKPKACNYGLAFARGEYLVIYDAEDMPDPLQLKKAYLGFQRVPEKVICLQAKLNYYNARQNLLTRFFTAEYSLWFDLTLTGLQSLNSAIPLGGTSNHFRTQQLRELQGWDPFNVTEDADLGVRIFQKGYQTSIVDSTTYEEATSKVKNWLRQRSRWIKGYMQTYLVHTRSLTEHFSHYGLFHSFIFQLTVGGKLLFMLLNPLLWIVTILYYTAFPIVGPVIHAIYVPPFSYIAVVSFVFGNFLFLYSYMIGCARRNQWDLMKYVLLIPVYWALMSWASMIALYQLILKPHYWEKTMHGFHLGKKLSTTANETFNPLSVPVPAVAPAFAEAQVEPVPFVSEPVVSNAAFVTPTEPEVVTPVIAEPVKVKKIKRFSENRMSLKAAVKHLFGPIISLPYLQTFVVFVILFLDVLLAKLNFSSNIFYDYIKLSLITKPFFLICMIATALFVRTFNPKKEAERGLRLRIFFEFLFGWIYFVLIGLEGAGILPTLYTNDLPFYIFALLCFAISNEIVFYQARQKNYFLLLLSLFVLALEMPLSLLAKGNADEFIRGLAYLGSSNLILVCLFQANRELGRILGNNISGFLGLFKKSNPEKSWKDRTMKILIFNWRDTKHVYAGGAEVYVHELGKRWVKDGNKVTLFCGNDQRGSSYEVIDGIEIYRRGGTYTVYLFAFLYYLLKFRGKYDIIIDCENGIPFFTPLFSRKPIVLLIHHVHQEIFHVFLKFPFNYIAKALEGKLMPAVYRNRTIVTVSESSKQEIFKLGFTRSGNITIVHNGVSDSLYIENQKTSYPSFIYLGRLQKHKNIDVAVRAFAKIQEAHPEARLSIVGWGEAHHSLKKLVNELGLTDKVEFLGRVSEAEKARLLGQSWAMIQPSQVEGWGITVIEANAAGTPVIASRVNGLRDSVVDGKTGILVEAGNVKKFAIAMQLIIADESFRKQLSLEGYQWAKNFDWKRSAEDFYQLIGKNFGEGIYMPVYGNLAVSSIESVNE
jgi:cellulose synthase/poly-beta-1,6-N-acetylglucosamine synthase-like glycosyltransferase/glycosyltransferase involved in cell wall biosynthesis